MKPVELIIKICTEVLNENRSTQKFQTNQEELIVSWRKHIQDKSQDPLESQSILIKFTGIIYELERNGDKYEHASKLNWLFSHNLTAAAYRLKYYAEKLDKDIRAPLHDLCMAIPFTILQTIPPLYTFGEGNLKFLFMNLNEFNLILENIDILEKRIPQADWKKTAVRDMLHHINLQLAKDLGLDLQTLSEQDNKRLKIIVNINKRFKRPNFENAKEILELLKKAQNSDATLPPLIMKTEEIGLPAGYYMAKMPDDDVRSAMAGYLVGCCQRVGGQGEPCVRHSITSPYGCTYAIFRGKIVDQKTEVHVEKDEPVALSWTWADLDHGLCFDSIESDANASKKMEELLNIDNELNKDEIINVIYTEFADRLLNLIPKTFSKISVGSDGQTPDEVGHNPCKPAHFKLLTPNLDLVKKYSGYRDSRRQRILALRESQHYYKHHALNYETMLKTMFETKDDHELLNLRLLFPKEYKIIQEQRKQNLMWSWMTFSVQHQLPSFEYWHLMDQAYDISFDEFANEKNLYLSQCLPKKGHTVLYQLLGHYYQLGEKLQSRIKFEVTAEDINYGSDSESCLIYAIRCLSYNRELIWSWLERGGDPNQGDIHGNTFVHHLAEQPKATVKDIVSFMKRFNLDFNMKDDKGATPLDLLLTRLSFYQPYRDHENILTLMSHFPQIDETKFLKVFKPSSDTLKTRLYLYGDSAQLLLDNYSSDHFEADTLEILIKAGARPKDMTHFLGQLVWLMYSGKSENCIPVFEFMLDNKLTTLGDISKTIINGPECFHLPLIQWLINKGQDFNEIHSRSSLTHFIMKTANLSLFDREWIKQYSLDLHALNHAGCSPLYYLLSNHSLNYETISWLINDLKIDKNLLLNLNHLVYIKGEIVCKLILNHGAIPKYTHGLTTNLTEGTDSHHVLKTFLDKKFITPEEAYELVLGLKHQRLNAEVASLLLDYPQYATQLICETTLVHKFTEVISYSEIKQLLNRINIDDLLIKNAKGERAIDKLTFRESMYHDEELRNLISSTVDKALRADLNSILLQTTGTNAYTALMDCLNRKIQFTSTGKPHHVISKGIELFIHSYPNSEDTFYRHILNALKDSTQSATQVLFMVLLELSERYRIPEWVFEKVFKFENESRFQDFLIELIPSLKSMPRRYALFSEDTRTLFHAQVINYYNMVSRVDNDLWVVEQFITTEADLAKITGSCPTNQFSKHYHKHIKPKVVDFLTCANRPPIEQSLLVALIKHLLNPQMNYPSFELFLSIARDIVSQVGDFYRSTGDFEKVIKLISSNPQGMGPERYFLLRGICDVKSPSTPSPLRKY